MRSKEFSSTLTKLRKETIIGGKQANKSSSLPEGRLISAKEEDFIATNQAIVDQIFKGKDQIGLSDFEEFRHELRNALRHYEFHMYDVDEETDTISAEDFAKSLLTCMPYNQKGLYVKRIGKLNLEGKISWGQFVAFQNFIDDVEQLKEKVVVYRFINKSMLREVVDDFQKRDKFCCQHGVHISDEMIDVMIQVLDLDGNGQLDHDEVVGVLEGRH